MFQLLTGFIAQGCAVFPKMQQLDLQAVPAMPVLRVSRALVIHSFLVS